MSVRRRRIAIRAVTAGAVCGLLVAAPAFGTVTCAHNSASATPTLDITITGTTPDAVRLVRATNAAGSNINIFQQIGGPEFAVPCAPSTPTVNTVSFVTVTDNTSGGNTNLTIDQSNGPFAPGTIDSGDPDEIKWGPIDLNDGTDTLNILPQTNTVDTMRFGNQQPINLGAAPVWNLNNDADGDGGTIDVEQYNVFADTPNTGEANDDVITADLVQGVGISDYPAPLPVFINFFGGGGNDTLKAGSGGSLLTGDAGNDGLTGGSGFDSIRPGTGNDVVDGGGGATDQVSFFGAASAVTVDLGVTAQQDTLGAGLDTITNTERLQGSTFGDTLTGTTGPDSSIDDGDNSFANGADTLLGLGGDDTLTAHEGDDTLTGGPGNDSLTAGPGTDTLSYAQGSTGPVTINLGIGTQAAGGAGTDTLVDPGATENVIATPFADDVLTGNALPNFFDIRDGNHDTVTCLAPANDSVRGDMQGVDSIGSDCESLDLVPTPVVTPPVVTTTTKKKKCKKKKKRHAVVAKKKCKKKKK